MSAIRHAVRGRNAAGLVLLVFTAFHAGCVTTARQPEPPPPPAALAAFRAAAIKVLEDAAFGDSPAGRIHAIEAFLDVAPDDGMALQAIPLNIENAYAGASFAALMAAGQLRASDQLDKIRTRAEHADPHVRMAALYALHRLGDKRRTGELSQFLLKHRDARVRANAALILGRLGEPQHVKLLRMALDREKKDLTRLQLLESLAILGDAQAINRLAFQAHSARPQEAAVAIMMLANARCQDAEEVFLIRLHEEGMLEVRLQAARGLAELGRSDGMSLALSSLFFDSPKRGLANDPPEQQIDRVRGLAALALETMADPLSLTALREAFDVEGQSEYVRIAIARASIRTIDRCRATDGRRDASSFCPDPHVAQASRQSSHRRDGGATGPFPSRR